jgi:hypothetical protein
MEVFLLKVEIAETVPQTILFCYYTQPECY